jgi:MoaA/NifB/PqqE/SkfB family radical SAM enzyme
VSYREIKQQLLKSATRSKTPILGEFELTSACNYRCKMCYLSDHSSSHDSDTTTWKHIFTDAVQNGLLYALLTGGEVFLRKDFSELYNFLYDLGVKITLFSNGSTVTSDIINTLVQRPPELVAITLYGANNKTYEEITNIKNGFTNTNIGIDLLLKHNINTSVRTLPLLPIYNELDELILYAKKKHLILNYISYITPTTYTKRLNIIELLDFESRIKQNFSITDGSLQIKQNKETNCYALKAAYFINTKGDMQMCALAYTPKQSVLNSSIKIVFAALGKELKQLNNNNTCTTCSLVHDCPTCYARRLYETINGCNQYLRKYTELKHE